MQPVTLGVRDGVVTLDAASLDLLCKAPVLVVVGNARRLHLSCATVAALAAPAARHGIELRVVNATNATRKEKKC